MNINTYSHISPNKTGIAPCIYYHRYIKIHNLKYLKKLGGGGGHNLHCIMYSYTITKNIKTLILQFNSPRYRYDT
jgi:hypothetical protein